MPRFQIFGHVEFVLTIDFRLIGGLGLFGYSVERTLRGVIMVVLHVPRLTAEELNGARRGSEDSDGGDDAGGGPAGPSRLPTPRPPREAGRRGRRGNVSPRRRICEQQYGCE